MAISPRIVFSLLLNIVSSVGVIIINKRLVFIEAGFDFGTTLTILHFIITFAGCLMFARLGLFKIKPLPIRRVLSISAAFCGYVVFNNLSLLTNSVSVYQTSKIFCTPVIVAIEAFHYGKREPPRVLLTLIPVCVGVFLTVFSDANLTVMGGVWATLAIISNSLYTIWGKTKQDELSITAMQLLTYQAPISAGLLFFALPIDDVQRLMSYSHTPFSVAVIGLSCVFAFGVNFSFFLFVGQTSPLTMNVVGYLKTALVFVGGFLFLSSNVSTKALAGVTLTLAGLAMYTYMKLSPTPVGKQLSKGSKLSEFTASGMDEAASGVLGESQGHGSAVLTITDEGPSAPKAPPAPPLRP